MSADPLLAVEGLVKHYPIRRDWRGRPRAVVQAVSGVSFDIGWGETLGLVGESGCGKSTVARAILRLETPDAGSVRLGGEEITHLSGERLRRVRRDVQMVFQDPYASLNPRMSVADIVAEPLRNFGLAHGTALRGQVEELAALVGLRPDQLERRPHEFSGGQRQRISIARALALTPKLVVCDESVAALDVSVQAQIVNLLLRLQREMGLSYLFVSHDLAIVRHVSQRVAVMYLGKIVEIGPAEAVLRRPAHPYTKALVEAAPRLDRDRSATPPLAAEPPSPANPPTGCRFHTRCPLVTDRCRAEEPILRRQPAGRDAACHLLP